MNEEQFSVFSARLSGLELAKAAVVLGSGPSAPCVARWLSDDVIVVAINNAHQAVSRVDYSVYADDFPADRKHPQAARLGRSGPQYIPAMDRFGGLLFGGVTMVMAAGYWAIVSLPNSQIAFFGCDLTYDGPTTHFYGKGSADPLRPDASLQSLEAKSLRLFYFGLTCGCLLVNASDQHHSRLALPRLPASVALSNQVLLEQRAALVELEQIVKPLAATALAEEQMAPFDTTTYRTTTNWNSPEVWRHCARVDALWNRLTEPVSEFERCLQRQYGKP